MAGHVVPNDGATVPSPQVRECRDSYRAALLACTNALAGKAPDAITRLLLVQAAEDAKFRVHVSGDIR